MEEIVLKALEKSICKWDRLCMGLECNYKSSSCALCQLFGSSCENEIKKTVCPVMTRSDNWQCADTPWEIYNEIFLDMKQYYPIAISDVKVVFFKYSLAYWAERELIFLLKLLPEGHRWRDQI